MPNQIKQKGVELFQKGAYEEAIEAFEKARKAYASLNDEANQGEVFNNMGVVYRYMREWEKAEDAFTKSRHIFAQLGDRYREAQLLGNMGDLYEARKERERAGGYYLEAIEVLEQVGDIPKLIQTLRVMSGLRFRQARISEALQLYRRSIIVKESPNMLDRVLHFTLSRFLSRNDRYALPDDSSQDEDE